MCRASLCLNFLNFFESFSINSLWLFVPILGHGLTLLWSHGKVGPSLAPFFLSCGLMAKVQPVCGWCYRAQQKTAASSLAFH